MLRSLLTFFAVTLAAPVIAQVPVGAGGVHATECLLRVNPAPASWIIQGFDPFADAIAEGTFGVTFINEGAAECRFTPTFELRQPPFGLSKGSGKPIGYALLNLTDTRDVTPRSGRSQRRSSQREIVLRPKESRSMLYKLVADPDDVRNAGTYTQDVSLEAQDRNFRSLGGAPLVLGITILPSARIGLSGAYMMNDGQAVVNLGELRQGVAPVPLQLQVSSTGEYDISVSSQNSGQLRLGSSQWFIPYSIAIGRNAFNLAGSSVISGSTRAGLRRDSVPVQFIIGDVSNRRAGIYSDIVSVSITAR